LPQNGLHAPAIAPRHEAMCRAHAHRSGAADWSTKRKQRFANDPDNLLAVEAGANMSKGDSGLSTSST